VRSRNEAVAWGRIGLRWLLVASRHPAFPASPSGSAPNRNVERGKPQMWAFGFSELSDADLLIAAMGVTGFVFMVVGVLVTWDR